MHDTVVAKDRELKANETPANNEREEEQLNTSFLIGKWRLDIAELKAEVRRNATGKKQAEALIEDFDKQYESIEMEFYEDKRFAYYVNGKQVRGLWGISSDNASYYITFSDEYIELHEVIKLTNDKLVELPVAEVRKTGIPLKQMVYTKI